MNKPLKTTFIAVFTLLLLSPLAYAQDEKLRYIPLPPGELTITNGYSIDPDQKHAHPTSKN